MMYKFVCLLTLFAVYGTMQAQTIRIRVLDAKNGSPLRDVNVTANTPTTQEEAVVRVGKDGSGKLPIPKGWAMLSLRQGPSGGANPMRLAFFDCNQTGNEHGIFDVPIAQILTKGLVPRNTCGDKNEMPKPGELIFWALPRRWWQMDGLD